jgi:hypothetical protein
MLETLHCEIGNHPWDRERKRGKKPKNCPEHKPVVDPAIDSSVSAMQDGRKRKAFSDRKEKIKEIIEHPRAHDCTCGIHEEITDEEIRALGAGCGYPRWVCPILVAVRNSVYTHPAHEEIEILC